MPQVYTAKYFLVRIHGCSNKQALKILSEQRLTINGIIASEHSKIFPEDSVELDHQLVRKPCKLLYMALYKPRGVECTLNREIRPNLLPFIPSNDRLFPVGRLDKESEGLLLLTNDGLLYKTLALSDALKEKEYLVWVDSPLDDSHIMQLAGGIIIMGKKTRPATVVKTAEDSFRIILTQGMNRQIRRMCHKIGLNVTRLLRVRIDSLLLGDLAPGECRILDQPDIMRLKAPNSK